MHTVQLTDEDIERLQDFFSAAERDETVALEDEDYELMDYIGEHYKQGE